MAATPPHEEGRGLFRGRRRNRALPGSPAAGKRRPVEAARRRPVGGLYLFFLESFKRVCRREAVLLIAMAAALASMALCPPSPVYGTYIDFPTLCLLFCLMAVVAGFQQCGVFDRLAKKLLSGQRSFRSLALILVLLPFFSAMLLTNDVSLLTFVPFSILLLRMAGEARWTGYIVVLQTVAANLGSMLLPFGNPQNLFLYSRYRLSFPDFFRTVFPFAGVSLLGLVLAVQFLGRRTVRVAMPASQAPRSPRKLLLFSALFLLCLLSVCRVLDTWVLLVLTLAALLACSRETLRAIDYSLLLTFVCFFVFSGNLGQSPAVRQFLGGLLQASTAGTALLSSQLISNVPAAVLLSGFTENAHGLLLGTNIGGLGTPIASLASLISLRLYAKSERARTGRYLRLFTAVNLIGIAVLLVLAYALHLFP